MNGTTTLVGRMPRLHRAAWGTTGFAARSSRVACPLRSTATRSTTRRAYSVNTEGPKKQSLGGRLCFLSGLTCQTCLLTDILDLTARLSHAWNSTPTRWYPIPIALGAAVLVALQYKRSPFAYGAKEDQAVVESEGEGGARVKMKSSGPWQVSWSYHFAWFSRDMLKINLCNNARSRSSVLSLFDRCPNSGDT